MNFKPADPDSRMIGNQHDGMIQVTRFQKHQTTQLITSLSGRFIFDQKLAVAGS